MRHILFEWAQSVNPGFSVAMGTHRPEIRALRSNVGSNLVEQHWLSDASIVNCSFDVKNEMIPLLDVCEDHGKRHVYITPEDRRPVSQTSALLL